MSYTTVTADLNSPFHCSSILTLLDEYASSPEGGGQCLSAFVKTHLIPRLKQQTNAVVILTFKVEIPVGLLIGFEGFSTFACEGLLNIHDIIVSHAHRGHQISQRLLTHAEQIATHRNYCKLTLEVLEGNIVAKNAYKKFGFSGYQLDPTLGEALFWEKKISRQ